MTASVFGVVLLAAVLHAVWNALVKGGADKQLGMTAVIFGHLPLAVVALLLAPAPAPESWGYIAVGVGLHVGYQRFLLASYRVGDLTQVYPIARGVAPLLLGAASVAFLGVRFQGLEILGIFTIGFGILSLVLVRTPSGSRNLRAAGLALVTGCFIAAYSLVDGLGARLAGSALGFYAWLVIGNAAVIAAIVAARRPALFAKLAREGRAIFLIGGTASFVAFSIVIWAFTQAPIALVSALRETSIIFALLFGVVFLKEKLGIAKVFATGVVLVGAVMVRVG